MSLLFTPTQLGSLRLQNRMVMSPMTRSRAIDNVPNELMAKYYGQRSLAGLIITEGTATSANALGYARIPGVFQPYKSRAGSWSRPRLIKAVPRSACS